MVSDKDLLEFTSFIYFKVENTFESLVISYSIPKYFTGGKRKWRYDGRCGSNNRLPDDSPAECDPDGENPCCDDDSYGECGNTDNHCFCSDCVNYILVREWRESGGKRKWRSDGRCGRNNRLPDNSPAECDPDGENPCCSNWISGKCRNSAKYCYCPHCVDYSLVSELRKSGENCTVKTIYGFLKNVCLNERTRRHYFKCAHSDLYYSHETSFSMTSLYEGFSSSKDLDRVTSVCENDPHVYQACYGANTKITNSDVLCGGLFCDYKYIRCDKNCSVDKDCSISQISDVSAAEVCDDKCDTTYCIDEINCNGYKYGINCTDYGKNRYIPVQRICYGFYNCDKEKDEHCYVTESTPHSCPNYHSRWHHIKKVPILNYTRCSVFDIKRRIYPYCLNYLDQTNCSDVERVGGYCDIDGYNSSVSKYMLCYEYDKEASLPVKLCDDDFQTSCRSLSTFADCRVHKHRMCDGVWDCTDGNDEFHDMCEYMTKEFQCVRRFNFKIGLQFGIPVSWIMDNEVDCMDGLDEQAEDLNFCGNQTDKTYRFKQSDDTCNNVYLCPKGDKPYVKFEQLCDGVETCGDGAENKICRIARDLPTINKTALYHEGLRDVCGDSNCEEKEFIIPWIDVFGITIKLIVPTSKVQCSYLFGEYYLFLSCMDLCLDARCPLNKNRTLLYNSCPGQFPDRVYTLANNSFLTFVTKSKQGQYKQDYFQCNNSRCIEYKQMCDLIDDCGDMSDELNCVNHMICEDTLNSTDHEFISLSQRCDGIYDCFDLSDECNIACEKRILGNRILQVLCWVMGVLALILNSYTVFRGLTTLQDSEGGRQHSWITSVPFRNDSFKYDQNVWNDF